MHRRLVTLGLPLACEPCACSDLACAVRTSKGPTVGLGRRIRRPSAWSLAWPAIGGHPSHHRRPGQVARPRPLLLAPRRRLRPAAPRHRLQASRFHLARRAPCPRRRIIAAVGTQPSNLSLELLLDLLQLVQLQRLLFARFLLWNLWRTQPRFPQQSCNLRTAASPPSRPALLGAPACAKPCRRASARSWQRRR